jgi:GNAT superfamily N-acetyltransferase
MIKSYEEIYERQVYDLLKGYSLNWGDKALETVIAVDGERVAGIGSLSKKELHPYREYINIYVQPEKRRKGIGRLIFDELLSLSEIKRFQAATSSKNTASVSFLEKCGFEIARKCYTPQLKNNIALKRTDKYIDYLSLDELAFSQNEEVFKLQLENYRKFHQKINPLSETLSFNRWKEMISKDLDAEHSYVLVKEGAVEAYIFCYESEDEHSIEMGYVGGKDIRKRAEYLDFYREALNQLFTEFNNIEIEADNVDPFAFALLNEFKYDKSESWDTYVYDVK